MKQLASNRSLAGDQRLDGSSFMCCGNFYRFYEVAMPPGLLSFKIIRSSTVQRVGNVMINPFAKHVPPSGSLHPKCKFPPFKHLMRLCVCVCLTLIGYSYYYLIILSDSSLRLDFMVWQLYLLGWLCSGVLAEARAGLCQSLLILVDTWHDRNTPMH